MELEGALVEVEVEGALEEVEVQGALAEVEEEVEGALKRHFTHEAIVSCSLLN